MHHNFIRYLSFLAVTLMAFTLCSCVTNKAAVREKNADLKTGEAHRVREEQYHKTLDKAIEQAREQGSEKVDVSVAEQPDRVQPGDLVVIEYTASFEDGSLIRTTRSEVARDGNRRKASIYSEPSEFGPKDVRAGEPMPVPGMEKALLGMRAGEAKTVTIPPEETQNDDPKKRIQLPRVLKGPRLFNMSFEQYVKKFKSFPIKGKEIDYSPYVPTRIHEVSERQVTLELLGKNGQVTKDSYGMKEIRIEGDNIIITIDPEINGSFRTKGPDGRWIAGRIIESCNDSFTVDFNPRLAQESIVLEVKVLSLVKASRFRSISIPWIKDHDEALKLAAEKDKPVVLVLYSSTCSWSKRLLNETLKDPRIKVLKDDFIWAGVDSSVHEDLYAFYEQKSYPLTLVLSPQGEILRRLEGYLPAPAFRDGIR
jgi:FKBP-type peptidyl-prolyl cis-trans isomerase 2